MPNSYGPSKTLKLTIGEVTRPLSYWAEVSGICHQTIRKRLKLGMPATEAVFLSTNKESAG